MTLLAFRRKDSSTAFFGPLVGGPRRRRSSRDTRALPASISSRVSSTAVAHRAGGGGADAVAGLPGGFDWRLRGRRGSGRSCQASLRRAARSGTAARSCGAVMDEVGGGGGRVRRRPGRWSCPAWAAGARLRLAVLEEGGDARRHAVARRSSSRRSPWLGLGDVVGRLDVEDVLEQVGAGPGAPAPARRGRRRPLVNTSRRPGRRARAAAQVRVGGQRSPSTRRAPRRGRPRARRRGAASARPGWCRARCR